jgi:hypothetical protein
MKMVICLQIQNGDMLADSHNTLIMEELLLSLIEYVGSMMLSG